MFDNLNPNQANNNQDGQKTDPSASGLIGRTPPAEPADMFAAVKDLPAKPAVLQPKNNLPPLAGYNGASADQDNMKKYFVLATIVLVLMLLLAGAFISYKYFFPAVSMTPAIENNTANEKEKAEPAKPIEDQSKKEEPAENQVHVPYVPPAATTNAPVDSPAEKIDTDQDGLTDEEENNIGTDSRLLDSDNDGLFDREEAKVYKTNPLNADTDGDGYLDGEEVKKGYNPLGPGKLYEVNSVK
jgi:hypothetical protein